MTDKILNDLTIYDSVANSWWTDDVRWIRILRNLVPGRLAWFDRHVEWSDTEVLDLGCAGGFMAEALAARGARVTGIDPAEEAIAAARDHANRLGLDIQYDIGVGENLPYDENRFDRVVCVDVLEHVSDLKAVIREVARVLRPGGVFLYDTINRNWLSRMVVVNMAEDVLRLLPKGTHDPAMFIKPTEMKELFEESDLAIGPSAGLGPRGLDRKLDFTFGPVPFKTIQYMGIGWKA